MHPWLWQPASHQPRLPEGRKGRWNKKKKVAAKKGWEERVNYKQERQLVELSQNRKREKESCWNHCREEKGWQKKYESGELEIEYTIIH